MSTARSIRPSGTRLREVIEAAVRARRRRRRRFCMERAEQSDKRGGRLLPLHQRAEAQPSTMPGATSIIEMMWDVVFADGEVTEFEENVVWRIAELLGVSTRDRVMLRQQGRRGTSMRPRVRERARGRPLVGRLGRRATGALMRAVALITGASNGIGADLARVFARHGHDLALTRSLRSDRQARGACRRACGGRPPATASSLPAISRRPMAVAMRSHRGAARRRCRAGRRAGQQCRLRSARPGRRARPAPTSSASSMSTSAPCWTLTTAIPAGPEGGTRQDPQRRVDGRA